MSLIVRSPAQYPLNTVIRSDSAKANQQYINLLSKPVSALHEYIRKIDISVPEEFEGREQWRPYLSSIRNQGNCGGCYAFSATSVLSDLINLQTTGSFHLNLSAARLIKCNLLGSWSDLSASTETRREAIQAQYQLYGCGGNTLMDAWLFLFTYGTNTQACFPDNTLESARTCEDISSSYFDSCLDKTPAVFYRARHIYAVAGVANEGGSEYEIRKHIYKFGPVSTSMAIYEDFYTFDARAIYKRAPEARRLSGHAVVLDGWGEENGVPFWWVRNSWGKDWGDRGYFRIIRGTNHCDIESNIIACVPDVFFRDSTQLKIFQDHLSNPTILRSIESPYTLYGGIDHATGLSRRFLSFAEFENAPLIQRVSLDEHFKAGNLNRTEKTPLLAYITIALIVIIFLYIL